MSTPSPNVAVYTENMVTTLNSSASLKSWADAPPSSKEKTGTLDDLKHAQQASDVATAGFDTVIVGLFHVHEGGAIYYNNTPVNSHTLDAIAEAIKALKTTSGSTVEKVLISFGGGNWPGHLASVSDSDYPNMKASWATFKPLLLSLLSKSHADGVDWDYEPVTTSFDTSFLIQITKEMAAASYLVTAAPYNQQASWLTVIEGTKKSGGTGNHFAWWNLQIYGGADYSQWVSTLQGVSTGLSNDAVEALLVPGYKPTCPASSGPAGTLRSLRSSYPSLNGAFIWKYHFIEPCAPAMASSIRKVFSSSQQKKKKNEGAHGSFWARLIAFLKRLFGGSS